MLSFIIHKLNPQIQKHVILVLNSLKLVIKLLALDQLSKWWVIGYLKQQPYFIKTFTSFFDFVYVWNYGISFGLFRNYYQYSNVTLIIVNLIIVIYLWYLLLKSQSAFIYLGYIFVIGGALGNIADRIFRGAVFDFIHFHYSVYSFPAFNLADAFITLGAIIISVDYYQMTQQNKSKQSAIKQMQALEEEAEKIRQLDDVLPNIKK
jgi:signal peptidase II